MPTPLSSLLSTFRIAIAQSPMLCSSPKHRVRIKTYLIAGMAGFILSLFIPKSIHALQFVESDTPSQTSEQALEAERPHHFIYLDFTRLIIGMMGSEMAIIGVNYEYRFDASGLSLLTALHGGYFRNGSNDDVMKAYGAGLGLRYYLYDLGKGPFFQAFADGGESRHNRQLRLRYGNFAIEYGYKLTLSDFLFSLHGGPQFHGFTHFKQFGVTLGIDLGFPLSARSFHLP